VNTSFNSLCPAISQNQSSCFGSAYQSCSNQHHLPWSWQLCWRQRQHMVQPNNGVAPNS